MLFEDLPTETITQVYLSCTTVSSAVALSSTCHRFRSIFSSSKNLLILSRAAEAEYGPLHDIVQLTTHNASQPAHLIRSAPLSTSLVRSIVRMGRIASRWQKVYPFKKWKSDFENRRLITQSERYVFRRALYRLWLFTRAFHNREHPRITRASPLAMHERAALLHNFKTPELAEMLDVHNVLRGVVANNICPSNGTIRRKFAKRNPQSSHQLLFNIHLNYPPPPSSFVPNPSTYYCSGLTKNDTWDTKYHTKFTPTRFHEPGAEGFGDDISHYYIVEDMLKLDPEQMLWLRDNAPYKGQVESYVRNELGEWFENNGETFVQSMTFVVGQRGGDMEEVREMVADELLGVAVTDDEG